MLTFLDKIALLFIFAISLPFICPIDASAGASKAPSQASMKLRKKPRPAGVGTLTDDATINSATNLLHKIFGNYVKEVMPDRPVVVSMDILLFKVKATVEKEGLFESVIGLVIEWRDKRMTWNPSDYGNLTLLAFDSEKVWLPDIAMTNSAEHPYQISRDSRFVVRVNYQGQMRFVPTGTARTWCNLRLLTFPFDIQTCSLEFESWSLDASTLTFDGNSSLILDSSFDSTQYCLCSRRTTTYDHTYNFSNETFTRVRVDLTIKRKSTFYVINLIFPCAVLSGIQLLVFVLSSVNTTVDRIGYAMTNLLTLFVFQTIVTEELPKTSDAVTALSKYITALILVSAVGIVESVAVERMLDVKRTAPPRALIWLLKPIPILFREASKSKFSEQDSDKGDGTPAEKAPMMITSFSMGAPYPKGESFVDVQPNVPFSRSKSNCETSGFVSDVFCEYGNDDYLAIEPSHSSTSVNSCLSVFSNIPRCSAEPRLNARKGNHYNYNEKSSTKRRDYVADKRGHKRPRLSTFLGIKPVIIDEAKNAKLWREIAFRVDFLSFVICASLVILIPCGLFLPLVFLQQECEGGAEHYGMH